MEKEKWRIDFTWIKAHASHSGNELAEKLAKEAIKTAKYAIIKFRKAK